tara:strand:- start:37 stop:672 length:636 start_codon:yes stop_codon:yes gene_type:complete
MHKDLYNINVAFFCSENLMKSLEEVKPFLGFSLDKIDVLKGESSLNSTYNVVVVESENEKKLSLENVNIPKVLVEKQKLNGKTKVKFDLVIKLPVNLSEFNQAIIDLSQKYKFDQNSLIKINDYILDKNERVLKKNSKKLKITEKEINFIEMLFSSNKPLKKKIILETVWQYSTETDTHTVETHIYRLRQKIKNCFNDDNFIKYTEKGYLL